MSSCKSLFLSSVRTWQMLTGVQPGVSAGCICVGPHAGGYRWRWHLTLLVPAAMDGGGRAVAQVH